MTFHCEVLYLTATPHLPDSQVSRQVALPASTEKRSFTESEGMHKNKNCASSLQLRSPLRFIGPHIPCLAKKAAAVRTWVPTCDLSTQWHDDDFLPELERSCPRRPRAPQRHQSPRCQPPSQIHTSRDLRVASVSHVKLCLRVSSRVLTQLEYRMFACACSKYLTVHACAVWHVSAFARSVCCTSV